MNSRPTRQIKAVNPLRYLSLNYATTPTQQYVQCNRSRQVVQPPNTSNNNENGYRTGFRQGKHKQIPPVPMMPSPHTTGCKMALSVSGIHC
ncbi:hypothetical protein AVEN_180087-1 [Araneus ventricosus]|uniref:Uncharacterized protein n=1 Tax=Araneus ventricosus TaxID=182803 RepID=A0A4Y2N998_ARAVE|nr:hypothetical protein AVEN_180087-1 [Araneus ventricosus]